MIKKFTNLYGKERVVLPVIHVQTWEQTLKNVVLAHENGADGVWIISHGEVPDSDVLAWQSKLNDEVGIEVGVNLLTLDSYDAIMQLGNRSNQSMGIWADNAGVNDNDFAVADKIQTIRFLVRDGLYFGGVAFKYQKHVSDLRAVTAAACQYVDVITTSGSGTGSAASVEKIATMREAAGNFPIAIASGITPKNVTNYLPYANAFMVSTGIAKEGDFYNIDRDKLVELVQAVREY